MEKKHSPTGAKAKAGTKHEKAYKAYIDSLYPKEEQKAISARLAEYKQKNTEMAEYISERTAIWVGDFLLLNEKYRLLKKHFKLTDEAANAIVNKMMVLPPVESKFVEFLNKGRDKKIFAPFTGPKKK